MLPHSPPTAGLSPARGREEQRLRSPASAAMPKLIGYGYDFEQATHASCLPKNTPVL
ncbi:MULTISPECIES: hypothetical protein [Hydrocarboniphaga]|uniref:Uncharacterized protein n=1 Tax=Hydrocarboniphaga effusa AP103 TaxID=1172194 RepID=I7ZA25_9GAMM|nr:MULTISPECIES: hypothetical protein [Hydrocarboniphaga]EIT68487.1 hypothetical protein WQQ_36820 [Hydrocarboniphaga effusa AP103]MDZ4077157.1 hypothetical protein [Hydrocarboniphaga sp.]